MSAQKGSSGATKRPWQIYPYLSPQGDGYCCRDIGASGLAVAHVLGGSIVDREANAALIVEAVNRYDAYAALAAKVQTLEKQLANAVDTIIELREG